MKKIAIFHPSNELYGADRIMVLAAKALKNYKAIIYLPKEGPLSELIANELPEAELKINPQMPIISRSLFSPKGIFKTIHNYLNFKKFIKREFNRYHFDKFYVNTLSCSILLPALKKFKTPIITHVHEILENPKLAAFVTAKLAFHYSRKVISVSVAVQSNLHRICKRRKATSLVVHNGIPAINTRELKSINEDITSFYLFGRIKPEKGQWYLIKALELIPKEELKDTHFNLVGGTLKGKEYLTNDLINNIKKAGLEEFITLKGFTNDISVELADADVCLVPSLMKDPFPTTVLEAMSAGKAIIASDTGGAKEAITNNISGIVIPADDPFEFAQMIRKLIGNKSLINKLGTNAKESFDSNYTIRHFNERWRSAV